MGNFYDGQPAGPDYEALWKKISRYCAYQERSALEVRRKLKTLGAAPDQIPAFLEALRDQNFLDEARFAQAFARGKFYNNRWGRMRIRRELQQRQIPEGLVTEALLEIPEKDYDAILRDLLRRQMDKHQDQAPVLRNHKAAAYAFRRGYEADLIWSIIRTHYAEDLP